MFPRTALLLLLARCFISSFAQVNVTIDDGDPAIGYTGTWTTFSSSLDAGGSHRLGEDDGVLANFTFTGTAIYFMSPLWPYGVFTQLQLDSQPPVQLNLSDPNFASPSQNGEETVQSAVVWGIPNLPNVSHTLRISKAPGLPYAIVDTLIYTRPDPTPPSSPSPSTSTIGTTTATPFATHSPAKQSSQSSVPVLTIALTTIFGFLGICLAAVSLWVCCKSRQRQKPEKRGLTYSPPFTAAPQTDPLSPEIAAEFKNVSWPRSNSQVPPVAPLIPHPQPLIYQPPPEVEQNFNPYITTPQTRMTYQQFPNPYMQQKTLPFSPTSLSTITEKSTPTGTTGSPVSLPSTDLSYYTPGSQSIKSGAVRLSYASDTSPGVVESGKGYPHQAQPRLHASGSIAPLRSPASFSSLGHEVTRPGKVKEGKNKQVAVNRVEDGAESSKPPAYRPH